MKQLRIAAAALIVGLVLSGGTPAHAQTQVQTEPQAILLRLVRPVLECVSANGDGTYTAVFGTYNDNSSSRTIPVGVLNFIPSTDWDRGQPTTFAPGRTVASFSVTFTGHVTWAIDGIHETALPSSQPCNSAPNVSEAGTPVLLALTLMVMGGGWMTWQRRRTT
jgi:hypothetical protein